MGKPSRSISARSRPTSGCWARSILGTLISVGNLALLYQDQGRYGEAEPLLKRALEAKERVLGREHPDTLTSVNNLAVLYRDQGRYARGGTESRSISARSRPMSGCWARSIPVR